MKSFLVVLLFPVLLVSCGMKTQDDPRISELQKDVVRLSDENRQLELQMKELQLEMQKTQTQVAAPATQTAPAPVRAGMTVERMKAGVTPVLEELLRKIKASSDTPKRGDGYGMRTEFDIKHAVFGLVQSKDSRAPYAARVIVRYEKFLESHKESRSYGSGSEEFHFVYRNQKWVYEKPQ